MGAADADWGAIGLDPGRVAEVAEHESARVAERTPRSAELLRRGRERMPLGVPMGWMAGLYPDPPIFAERGEGATFWDVDGNAYLDFNLCDLSTPCGFAPPALIEAIARQARLGIQFLLPTEDGEVVAAELERRFGMPSWQLTLSASLANTEALRLARVATGRDRIVVFGGRYHGHIDDTLLATVDGEREGYYMGLPAEAGTGTVGVEFNDLDGLQRALAPGDVAAVILEPVLTNCTVVLPDHGFLPGVRGLCDEHGALLVVDETHTQFAVYGGGTRRLELRPDVVTVGKGIAGGIPIGAYGMTPELAELMERHAEGDFAAGPGLATGGTLFGNALSLAAARTVLTEILTEDAYAEIERLGGRLANGIDTAVAAHGLQWRAHRFGGRTGFCLRPELPRTEAEAEASLIPLLAAARRSFLANRGIWDAISTSGPSISTAHREADVERYRDVLDEFLTAIA